MVTADSGETYHVNGHCSCRAGQVRQPGKHLALRRPLELYEAEPEPKKRPASRIVRSVETSYPSGARVQTVRIADGWYI
jgi:hypothetical protein